MLYYHCILCLQSWKGYKSQEYYEGLMDTGGYTAKKICIKKKTKFKNLNKNQFFNNRDRLLK